MSEENLEPCPFCGSDNIQSGITLGSRFLYCNSCSATGPRVKLKVDSTGDRFTNDSDRVDAWNTRAVDIDEIKAALEECHQAFRDRKNGRVAQAELRERLEQIFGVYYE